LKENDFNLVKGEMEGMDIEGFRDFDIQDICLQEEKEKKPKVLIDYIN